VANGHLLQVLRGSSSIFWHLADRPGYRPETIRPIQNNPALDPFGRNVAVAEKCLFRAKDGSWLKDGFIVI
jgi:hypothetical protein